MRALLCFAVLLKLLLLAEGFTGPAFHPAGLSTAAVLHSFCGTAQDRAEFELCLPSVIKLPPLLNTCLSSSWCSTLLRPFTNKKKSVSVRSLSSGPTCEENPDDFGDKLRNLDARIARVEAAIQAAEDKANAEIDTKERDYWRGKEKQLREKEKQLREEASDLRKLALVRSTAGAPSGTVAPAAPTPELLSLPPGPELNRDSLLDENEQNKRIVYRRFQTSFKGLKFPAPFERARAATETEDVIERNLEKIKSALASHDKSDRQSWKLLVIPQSRGGGKTTMLDELRFQLLRRGTVAVPVSFNGFTHLDQDGDLADLLRQHPTFDTPSNRVRAALFARIAFAVLDHEQGTYARFMQGLLVPFMRAQFADANGGKFTWDSLFTALFRTASARSDKIVFLVDEIALLERIGQGTSLTGLLKEVCFDFTLALPAVPAVVVSTLDLAPFELDFKTSTGTRAELLALPSTFFPGNLLEQGHWFYNLDQLMQSSTEKALLRTLMGILCSWPRGLEWLHLELNRAGAEETTLRALLQYVVFKEIDGQGYAPNRFPDGGDLAVWDIHTLWIGLCPCSFEDRVAMPTLLDAQAKDTEGASVASLYANKVLEGTVQYDPRPSARALFLHQPSLSILAMNSLAGCRQDPREEAAGVSGPSAALLAKMVLQLLRDRAVSILREELEGGTRISVFLEDLLTRWARLLLKCRYDARAYLESDDPATPSWAKEALTPARLFPGEGSYSVSASGNLVDATLSDERFADFGIPLLPVKYVELSAPVQADTERLSSDEQQPAWSQLRAMGPGYVWVVRCCDSQDEGSQGCDDLICWRVEGGGLRMVLRDAKAAPAPPGLGRAAGNVATRPQDPDALRRKIAKGAEMAARFSEQLADSYGNDVRCCQVVISMGTRCSTTVQVDHHPSVPCFVSFFDSTMVHFGPLASIVGQLSQRFPQA